MFYFRTALVWIRLEETPSNSSKTQHIPLSASDRKSVAPLILTQLQFSGEPLFFLTKEIIPIETVQCLMWRVEREWRVTGTLSLERNAAAEWFKCDFQSCAHYKPSSVHLNCAEGEAEILQTDISMPEQKKRSHG